MSFVSRVNQMDLWILDRVFQPIADRLPEKWPPFEVGMSFQLGALLFYATSVILIMVINGLGLASAFFDVLSWVVGLALFVGIMRMRVLVRPGHANPLRIMLQGLRRSPSHSRFSRFGAVPAGSDFRSRMVLYRPVRCRIFRRALLHLLPAKPAPGENQ